MLLGEWAARLTRPHNFVMMDKERGIPLLQFDFEGVHGTLPRAVSAFFVVKISGRLYP